MCFGTGLLPSQQLMQVSLLQVSVFQRWGIRTVAVNEDSPDDKDWWEVRCRHVGSESYFANIYW